MAGQKTDQRDVYVGQRIAEQRRKASLTQRRVAQSFGMSAARLQKYEKGTNRISAIHLDIFSRMTGVPLDHFFSGMPRLDDHAAEGFSEPPQRPLDGGWQSVPRWSPATSPRTARPTPAATSPPPSRRWSAS